jgi:glycosyltransferase involved in cell wall biosynthesis
MKPRIAYLRFGVRPLANRTVHEVLVEQLPEFDVVAIDVKPAFRKHPLRLARVGLAGLRYAPQIIDGRHDPKKAVFRTRTAFDLLRKTVVETLAGQEWAATFQMQSLFDGSLPGVPHVVYTDHTHLTNLSYPSFDPRRLYSRAWIQAERQVFDNASAVLTRSTNVTQTLVHTYGIAPEKVRCVYIGVNVPVDPAPPAERDPNEVLFIGSDWKRKGGPDLLAAWPAVRAAHPTATLTIVGCEPPGTIDGVRVIGRVAPGAVAEHFARAGVFCLPTLLEPFGVVFVEALTAGLPIVATDVGAIPDIVDDGVNGRLVPPGDVSALAAALCDLVGNTDMQAAYGAVSRQRASERYNWATVGPQLRENILEAIDQPIVPAKRSSQWHLDKAGT